MNILNKLTIKHLKMNKKRTIVTIVGVILSCSLMVGICLMFSSLQYNLVQTAMKNGGKHHAIINNVKNNQFNMIRQNVNVEEVNYEQVITLANMPGEIDENYAGDNSTIIIKNANDGFLSNIELVSGRKPIMDNELLIPVIYNDMLVTDYKIGDVIKVQNVKKYINNEEVYGDVPLEGNEEVTIENTDTKEYKIVGFYYNNNLTSDGINFYTKDGLKKHENIKAYITYKEINNIVAKTESIADKIDKCTLVNDKKSCKDVSYNQKLLSVYGQSSYTNYNRLVYQLLATMLSLVSIACIIVIYNSFNISVMERKKQFGLFSSIGATKRQLRYTVFYEALIIALIGIPLGILGGFIGIATVISIINNLMPNIFDPTLTFHPYASFVYIPVIFMIVVIFISAYLPAKRASKVTPIEAIRQNDDIKIKGKKVKTNRLIRKIFGVEGDIALKNIKRNKKKYRITVVSIFISIVLFISFAGFLKYGLYGSEAVFNNSDYDAIVYASIDNYDEVKDFVNEIKMAKGIKKSQLINIRHGYTDILSEGDYNEKLVKENPLFIKQNIDNNNLIGANQIRFIKMEDEDYNNYIKELGLVSARPIVLNNINLTNYINNERKTYLGKYIDEKDTFNIYSTTEKNKKYILNNLYYTDKTPLGIKDFLNVEGFINIIINNDIESEMDNVLYENKQELNNDYQLYLLLDKENNVDEVFKNIIKDKDANKYSYFNLNQIEKEQRNFVLVLKLLLYGFISLVTLIGITSVFNTINTSLLLRKKEFAMLRSIGLTTKGFNKILLFESFFFVFKALLYSLPVSIGIIYLIHVTIGQSVTMGSLLIPWNEILIAIIFAFIIVLMTTIYSTRKMRKENILEAIRTENI